jgi:hypothetical protein
MQETVEQYIARITGNVGDSDPRAILEATPARLRSLIDSATPAQLTWTTSPTRWTITQIVAHLSDAEIVGAWRFRTVLEQDKVTLQAYDQGVWAASFGYTERPPLESVTLFEALRRSTLRTLDAVEPSRLQHVGMHAERGPESITRLMIMYAGHDINHLKQIETLLEESRSSSSAGSAGSGSAKAGSAG